MKVVEVVAATEAIEATIEVTLAIEVAIKRTSEEARSGRTDLATTLEERDSMEEIKIKRVLKKEEMLRMILTTISV